MSLELWKAIQSKVGAEPDGIPGPATARKIAAALGVSGPAQPQEQRFGADRIVTGAGKNIRRIVLHCTATREGQDIDAATIKRWHLRQGWSDIGYHFVIRLDGTIEKGRPEQTPGSHVKGFNTGSIGVVYVGGLDAQGRGKDTRTVEQKAAMADLVRELTRAYPQAAVMGHRDLSPDKDGDGVIERHEWMKECPCFDARSWWESVK
jgi:N-acetyl-anhydromuramyl-L-alanine amidase AmpD